MQKRVYVETSIISYLTARPSRDLIVAAHQEITRQWWETERAKYALCASEVVLREARAGGREAAQQRIDFLKVFNFLEINAEVDLLTRTATTISVFVLRDRSNGLSRCDHGRAGCAH